MMLSCGFVNVFAFANVLATEVPMIAVINDHDNSAYLQTLAGFESSLAELRNVKVQLISAEKDPQQWQGAKPDLVFALGNSAVESSQQIPGKPPVLVTMIHSSAALENLTGTTAILIKTSAREQLQWHKRLLPEARRVGVLYNPDESESWVNEAKRAATGLNLEIVAIPVASPRDLPAALKALGRQADSLLGIPDKVVYSSRTAKAILLFSFRNRIPFIGMSGAWVKAGALYGLEWNYDALGRQCAKVALQLIDGKSVENLVSPPGGTLGYRLNLKTAKQMKLSLSQELIERASEVYQ